MFQKICRHLCRTQQRLKRVLCGRQPYREMAFGFSVGLHGGPFPDLSQGHRSLRLHSANRTFEYPNLEGHICGLSKTRRLRYSEDRTGLKELETSDFGHNQPSGLIFSDDDSRLQY